MYARENKILIGDPENPSVEIGNSRILSCSVYQSVALVGQELSVDEFKPVVTGSYKNSHAATLFQSSDGKVIRLSDGSLYAVDVRETEDTELTGIPYGTPTQYKHNEELVGQFYFTSVKREAKDKYQINSVSAIGLLDKMYTGGGLFLASNFKEILDFILASGLHGTGDPVIPYRIDPDVEDLPVSGWLPYSTKRNALYQLIFSNGVNIKRDFDGVPMFTFIYAGDDEDAAKIETVDIYNGGSVEFEKPYSRVEVLEHTYTADTTAEAATLFDNSDSSAVEHEEIWFDSAPVIVSTMTATGGLTIDTDPATGEPKVTENSAVISGTGVLTGVPYTHTTRTAARDRIGTTEEKVVSVTDCTLVSLTNSENLVERLFAFYCPEGNNIEKIKNSIIHNNERCGKAYAFRDPFGRDVVAYLASMEINASSINKATCEWYGQYKPAGQAGLYRKVKVLMPEWDEETERWVYGGTWTVPEGVTQFRAVLIGGGTGGSSGYPGQNGEDAYCHTNVSEDEDLSGMWFGAKGGAGGAGGYGGRQGRVKVVEVEDAVPGTEYSFTLGQGGAGGAATGFIPDTLSELKDALENEDPETEYTDEEIQEIIDDYVAAYAAAGKPCWSGAVNAGSDGTATSFGIEGGTVWSTDDQDVDDITGRYPVYEQITDTYYNLPGKRGLRGGDGGARQVESGETFAWTTDGEDIVGPYYHINGEAELPEGEEPPKERVYHGGSTGNVLTSVSGLEEAVIKAYGGNGAGAAVGLDARAVDEETVLPIYEHMHGASNQSTEWWVSVDG